MALGKQIRKYREARGWTLEQLEEASGVPGGTINALENRDSRRSNYAQALANALGLRLDQLLDEATQHTPPPGAAHEPAAQYQAQGNPVTLRQALAVLALHVNGLDPPMQQAIGALLSGLCTNPAAADVTSRQIAALLEIQGNGQAQRSTNTQAA